MDSFVHVFEPDGSKRSAELRHPTQAPIEPLYRIPTGSTVVPSKVRAPSTYSSAAGSASSSAKASSDSVSSKVWRRS